MARTLGDRTEGAGMSEQRRNELWERVHNSPASADLREIARNLWRAATVALKYLEEHPDGCECGGCEARREHPGCEPDWSVREDVHELIRPAERIALSLSDHGGMSLRELRENIDHPGETTGKAGYLSE